MKEVQNTQDYLMQFGIKPSIQRMSIMEYMLLNRNHPTVEDIYSALIVSMPTLSKTTIYNTLKLFVETGAVVMLSIDEKNVRYDIELKKHAHFRCLECDCVYDIPVEDKENFYIDGIGTLKVTETHIYYRGYCEKCLSNKN
ncbi:MAG: Fur family transcriptional regulator [Marinifilaceae bacterium]